MTLSTLGLAALQLTQLGLKVHPLKPGDKRPLTRHGVKDASADPSQVERWWAETPDANVGLACGPIEGTEFGLLVVDCDDSSGIAWLRTAGLRPTVKTVKGEHVYLRVRADDTYSNNVRKLSGLDLRWKGGYVVAPPSIRDGSQAYTWADGITLQEAPESLLELLRTKRGVTRPIERKPFKGHPGAKTGGAIRCWEDMVGKCGPGNRNETLFKIGCWAFKLVAEGEMAEGDADSWLRAAGGFLGLPEREVDTVVWSARKTIG